jgi:DNA-binding transcriptional MerR regulator
VPTSLTIGDFSRATHLSVKTLRHYHQLGLLVPAEVDAGSGYRRYGTEQIPTAQVIRRFRDLDMPLEEIGEVLRTTDLRARNELIATHLARLENELAETQTAVASLRELLQSPPSALVIEFRRDEAIKSAAISEVIGIEDLSPWFQGAIGELYATVTGQHVATAGPPGGVIADAFFSDDRGEVTIFLPTAVPVRPVGRVAPRVLPAVELARRVGQVVSPGVHRHPHPLRRPGVLGPVVDPVVVPRGDVGGGGNCGFSIAPIRPEGVALLARTLQHVEDMSFDTLSAGVPWDEFETFPQYLDAVERRGTR